MSTQRCEEKSAPACGRERGRKREREREREREKERMHTGERVNK